MTTNAAVSIPIRGIFPLIGQIFGILMVLVGLIPYYSSLSENKWVCWVFCSSLGALFLLSLFLFVIFDIKTCLTNIINKGWGVENPADNLNIENVDKFIFWLGMIDSMILSILVIACNN